MSQVFNSLSSFVIAFLPRSKHLLISWLHSPSAVILELKKIKSVTVSTSSPYICHKVMGSGASQVVLVVKNPHANAEDKRDRISILRLERFLRRAWHPTSILAWRIPWIEEPGGLQSIGLQRVRHD